MFASWLIDGLQLMLASLRQIDMLTVLSLLYLAFIATLVGYGIWGSLLGRCETWWVAPLSLLVPVGMGQRCAAAGGDAGRDRSLPGCADHGRPLYQRFRSASLVRPGMARVVKKSPGDGAIHKYACNGITGRAAGSTARQVRQIYHLPAAIWIEIKRRVVMFRKGESLCHAGFAAPAWWLFA